MIKKLAIFVGMLMLFSACNGTHKTGGATRDSSASHGYSGPADSSSATGVSPGMSATSTGGSDTSTSAKDTAGKKP